jgi:hypothetical protein
MRAGPAALAVFSVSGVACALQRLPARHAWASHTGLSRATAFCAAVSDGGAGIADVEVDSGPSWRLAVQRARDSQTGREESRLALEPTDGRWAARQIEVEICLNPNAGVGIELSE